MLPLSLLVCDTGVRSLTVEGDLSLADFAGASKEGSLVTVGSNGRITLPSPPEALQFNGGVLTVCD